MAGTVPTRCRSACSASSASRPARSRGARGPKGLDGAGPWSPGTRAAQRELLLEVGSRRGTLASSALLADISQRSVAWAQNGESPPSALMLLVS
eukprot:393232-Pyramimonas_sp.AAC.1